MSRDAVTIRTPEGIVFALPLAGPGARFVAWGVDLACVGAVGSLLATAIRGLLGFQPDIAEAVGAVLYFGLSILYGLVLEWVWRGQTLGKRLVGLRVMDEEGRRLQPSQVVVRNLLRSIDVLPIFYLVGGAAMLASRHWQRLGDLVACTIVVRAARTDPPDPDALRSDKYNSLRGRPRIEARLRQRISPAEAALAVQAIVRRDAIEPAARVAIFRRLAQRFVAAAEIEPALFESVPDEQVVRNVLEIVLTRPGRAGVST
ncbi:MAG TPA: RDD family protein [Candidatus Polarisedimenticolia bacterium]|nr:RDD family protein [Candidatus Polarisedimenticolia bacterium]